MSKFANTSGRPTMVAGKQLVIHPTLHPAWAEFVRFCRELKYGEIENLRIQDGLPLMAEMESETAFQGGLSVFQGAASPSNVSMGRI
jgi:hypothetical protein